MKRIVVFCIAILLLIGCGGKEAAAPQVQMDARAETAPTAMPAEQPAQATAASAPTKAPALTEAPATPTAEPALAASGFVEELTARWETEGLLEGLYPFPTEDVLDYYGIDLSLCEGGAVFGDDGGYTNEAIVVQGDKGVLDDVEALLQQHLADLKAQFRDYDAAALALAEKAVLVREGDVVLFVISPNAEAMLKVLRDMTA